MTPQLESALAQVDEIIESWIHPEPHPEYPNYLEIEWQARALLSLGARCGAIEGVALDDQRIKMTIGRSNEEQIERIYEFDGSNGILRALLARLSFLTVELANPATKMMQFEATQEGRGQRAKFYKNNPYGFEMTFDFTDAKGTTLITVATRNGGGMPARSLDGYGFRISAV